MKPNYSDLADQYGGYLVAIGGVSITVLTLVLSAWRIQRQSVRPIEPDAANNRPTLVISLMIATFCSFVGAQLMAEMVALKVGETHFLLASVNIFIAVTVVIFAVMLLATEYQRDYESGKGIRKMSRAVFYNVLVCVVLWMLYSVTFRMPSEDRMFSIGIALVIVLSLFLGLKRRREKDKQENPCLLPGTFALIVGFTVMSLGGFVLSLIVFPLSIRYQGLGVERVFKDATVGFFVVAISFTCVSLFYSARCVANEDHLLSPP